jgi:hypothetical protein
MRTTLAIDDDVLSVAKRLAAQQCKSVGEVISTLARQALRSNGFCGDTRNGVRLLPQCAGASTVTLELVNQLSDELT